MVDARENLRDAAFESFEYFNEETGIRHISPFPVLIISRHLEFLGSGIIIGKLGDEYEGVAVVEVQDPSAPSGKVHLLGSECHFGIPTTNLVERAAKLSVSSAFSYACRIDANTE